jgi:hypothetical protein
MLPIIIEAAMDNKFSDILDSLPEPEPRSCLDPFQELIYELHRRGRTYREIARILAERCEVVVSVSTIYRFFQSRLSTKQKACKRQLSQSPKIKELNQTAILEEKMSTDSLPGSSTDEIIKRISDIKLQQGAVNKTSKLFHYDPNEPLHLSIKRKNNPID